MRRDIDQPDRRGPRPAQSPRSGEREDGPRSDVEAIVTSLQRAAGNAAVSRLLEGDRLPPSIQAAGERRLGADLGDVRVHADTQASRLAESLDAEALTVGQDVFMNDGAGGLETSRGRKTLLHELVHTAQPAGDGASGIASVSSPGSAAEREASAIASGGFGGSMQKPMYGAPAGIAHRKVADEEELTDEQAPVKAADLLDPKPLSEQEQKEGGGVVAPKAGDLGENEQIAFEIRVLAPFRRALAAAMDTEWETAVERMTLAGEAMWEYEQAYAKLDPAIATELRGIRGWLALAVTQMRSRYSGKAFSDGHIHQLIEEAIGDLEKLGPRLGARR